MGGASLGWLVIEIEGLMWPDDVGSRWKHSLQHVESIEWSIAWCQKRKRLRQAVQAGGNIGVWPRRLAQVFELVITFEPDEMSLDCLWHNVPENVTTHPMALGADIKRCGIKHRGLGSHRVREGENVPMTTVDSMKLLYLDFLQLDVEGYEWHALQGARESIERCRPLIQVELRGFTEKYGKTDDHVRAFLHSLGYREVSQQSGSDYVFECVH